jgi:hypothetical protein
LLPLGLAKGRAIVIAPNLTIKKGLYEAMDITNRQKCFWRKAGVLSQDQMVAGPLACTLDTGNISVATKSHIVITNVQQLSTNVDKWLTQFSDDFFDMIIIDEAHHSAAESWQKVIERFPNHPHDGNAISQRPAGDRRRTGLQVPVPKRYLEGVHQETESQLRCACRDRAWLCG